MCRRVACVLCEEQNTPCMHAHMAHMATAAVDAYKRACQEQLRLAQENIEV